MPLEANKRINEKEVPQRLQTSGLATANKPLHLQDALHITLTYIKIPLTSAPQRFNVQITVAFMSVRCINLSNLPGVTDKLNHPYLSNRIRQPCLPLIDLYGKQGCQICGPGNMGREGAELLVPLQAGMHLSISTTFLNNITFVLYCQ